MSREYKLEEISEIVDSLHQTPSYINIGYPMVRVTDITGRFINFEDTFKVSEDTFKEFTKKYLPVKGDIVMTRVGRYGSCSYVNDNINFCLGQNTVVISPKVNSDFLFYSLNSNFVKQQIEAFVTGSTQKTISLKNIKSIVIRFPENKEHTAKIAKVLSDIDTKIEVNNKINQQLEAMAKAFYDYWFVQFDFPDVEGKPYKSSGGKMVYNEKLKREIPENWEVDEIGEVLNTELGGTPSTKRHELWKGQIPWLNSGEIANFPIIDAEEYITEEAISNSATTLMPKGTCVLSITRHLRPSILGIDACANQSVVGILESEKLKSSFLYPYLVNEIPRLMTLRTGAQQPHINKKTVDNSLIVNPPSDILKRYYKEVNPIYKQIINNSFQNLKLTELRDWLLPMLMNGQITVGGAYTIKEDNLNVAAEPGQAYEKDKVAIDELFKAINYDYEVATIQMLTERRFGYTYGKKYTHKMFSNIELLNTMPKFKDLSFEEKGWGMFSKAIAKTIDNQKLIHLDRLDNGTKVLKVRSSAFKEVLDWTVKDENKEFVSQVNAMLTLYEKPLINKDMNRIELLNTVLECMKVLETDNLQAIRTKMANWEMHEEYNHTKAEKFTENETLHMIQFVKEVVQ